MPDLSLRLTYTRALSKTRTFFMFTGHCFSALLSEFFLHHLLVNKKCSASSSFQSGGVADPDPAEFWPDPNDIIIFNLGSFFGFTVFSASTIGQ